ncbi:winged helix DNA-binding domain-containing protein [Nonomuraea diastatica]|uniref:Winged helix DNA-binding domain-containing protein n=1 Tax=Nonomuraea diastatica TaxID=1848329 RepID=A0A4R4X2N3_9ACTN|nr:winged helix DNA-binding domain-containing protein [Nonomuraea diastatica]TDD24486.1 winged helix DNA-binding domain-containing protein [Nonomuraea diastatica]
MVIELTWPQVSARRLERSGLGGSVEAAVPAATPGAIAAATPAAIAGAMCGVHAQVMSAAEASIGLRLDGVTRAHVREALWTGRSLVKTYGPRGTVHLLPARDLPRWVGAMSSLPPAHDATPASWRMTAEQTELVVAAVREALAGAELTIDELSEAVVAATGPWAGDLVMPAFQGWWPRWRQALALAAHRGAFVFGAGRGRKVTYTVAPVTQSDHGTPAHRDGAADHPTPAARDGDPRHAGPAGADGAAGAAWLAGRYLAAYGPATPEQFARWACGPTRWAVEAFAAVEREEVMFAGKPAWVLAGDTETPAEPPRGVRLLPYFDAYVVAGRPRELLYAGAAASRALSGGQAGNFPVLLVDGVVGGVWHQRRSGRRIDITVEPLRDLSRAHLRELDEQVERVGVVMEGRPSLAIDTVTVGAHA